jgi:translation initiation factor IF-2
MAGAPKRLSKVAKELNVGISTLVEFLSDKGLEENAKPNTKIDDSTYEALLTQFMPDKAAKEKSQELAKNKVVRETITLEDQKRSDSDEDADDDSDDIFITNVADSPVVAPVGGPAPAEEPTTEKQEEKKEEPVKEEPVKSKAPAMEPVEKGEQGDGPQVVGRIDLDSLNLKTRPSKKAKPAPAPKKEEKPKQEKPKAKPAKEEVKPSVKAEEKIVEKKPEPPKEPETIKAEAQKLTGPTVVGKIELPVETPRKKKPVASSSDDKSAGGKKRKRKRIKPEGQQDNRKGPGAGKQLRNKGIAKPVKGQKEAPDEEAIQKEIKETLARLSGGGKSKASKFRREKRQAQAELREEELARQEAEKKIIKVTEFVTANELASLMDVQVTQVISACMTLGLMVSINQRLDAETLSIVAEEFGYEVEFIKASDEEEVVEEEVDNPEDLEDRSPIITVMGHVDHGKTSLLDYVRKANVIAGEAGGITQHIGAYNVELESGKSITFLDTPGHEAFTAMRARGTQVTDLVIIVIAADDSVMPQTKEAINHALAADVPIVFAFNKIDKPGANADKIREELAAMDLLVEDWGGKYQAQEISAKSGQGVDDLLEKVLLEAEMLELKANPKRKAEGTVIEASLDKGRGYVTTLLVQTGTLRVGDMVVAGSHFARIKAMFDERGQAVQEAGPSHPVSMLGFSGAPNAGDAFKEFEDEREAKALATKREQLAREQDFRTKRHITLDEIGRRLAIGDFQELNVIVKGDVDGSVEALADSLLKLSTETIQVNIIHKSVGQISESDVLLATASDAIIVGFQVRPSGSARKLAEKEDIDIRLYSVIYDAIDEVKTAMEGMLKPKTEEKVVCNIEIRETFKISKVGTIAGCYVLDGKVTRNTKVRLIREGVVVYTGELGSLKRFKDDVKEVAAGYECGLNIKNYNDIKEGDIIEGYEEVEVQQKL